MFKAPILAMIHSVINDEEIAHQFTEDFEAVLNDFGIASGSPIWHLLHKIRNENSPPKPTAADAFNLLGMLGEEILEIETEGSIW